MVDNPWNVADANTFLKYCCPECDYQITDLFIFEDHATSNHEMSNILFENSTEKVQEFEIPKIKREFKQEYDDTVEYDSGVIIEETQNNDLSKPKKEENGFKTSAKSDVQKNNNSTDNNLEFFCNFCDYKAKRKERLKVHLRNKHNEFQCKLCDFKANKKDALNTHLRNNHDELPVACHLCEYKSVNQTIMNKHILKIHGEFTNPCHICDFKTHQVTKLDEHLLQKHSISKFEGEFACPSCDFKTDHNGYLRKHIMKKHGEYTHPCHVCDFKTHRPTYLDDHLLQEHGISKFTGEFACHICDFKTKNNSFLSKHILRQHGEYAHPCHLCDFKTHLTTQLAKHLAEEHQISKYSGNLACHLCDYKTNSNRNLGTHVLRIHGEYTQSCHICDFKTHLVMELDEHLLKDHDISKYKGEFVCHVCDFKTDNNRNLNKHLFKLHGEYTHPCHLCDFKTYQPRKLDEHCSKEHGISKFSGEFACHVCDFKSDDRSNLNKHVKRIHNEESQESYSCDICVFKASLVAEVRKHLYDEHGVSSYSGDQKKGPQRDKEFDEKKKFMCHHCDFRTRYNNSLQNHLRLIHKEHIPKRKRSLNWKKSLKANWNSCHLCDFKSKFNSNLRNHVARIHGNSEVANIKKQEGKDESMEKLQSENEGVDFMDVTVTPDIKVENEPKILEKESVGKNNGDVRDGLCPHCGEVC